LKEDRERGGVDDEQQTQCHGSVKLIAPK